MNDLVIFGSGSLAEVAHFYFTHDSSFDVVAFTAHSDYVRENSFCGLPLVPFEEIEELYPPDDFHLFVAVGYAGVNRVRARIFEDARQRGYRMASYLSSKCTHWGDTKIGDNTFILEDNTLQPFVTIGDDTFLWSGNHIGHHATIGRHCFLTSHVVVSGHVTVGDYCFLGVNATVRDSIEIADRCVVGAGALIMKSTEEGEVFVPERTKVYPKRSDELNM